MAVDPSWRVFIALPAFGQVNFTQATGSIVNTALMLQANNLWGGFGTLSYPDIADLRNMWLTLWFERIKTSHLLMVDADMGFSFQMVADMIAVDKPLVGCIYPKKMFPAEFVGSLSLDQRDVPAGFARATGVGGGVMLIRRDCVERIIENDPSIIDTGMHRFPATYMLGKYQLDRILEPFAKIKTDKEYVSEDISFCRRASAAGVDILANVKHRVTHVGAWEFTGAFQESLDAAEYNASIATSAA